MTQTATGRANRWAGLKRARRLDAPDHWIERPRTVYLHIPKTAGSSLYEQLATAVAPQERLTADERAAGPWRWGPDTVARTQLITGHLPYSLAREVIGEAHYLTFLRDPIDRVVSQFLQWQPARIDERTAALLEGSPEMGGAVARASSMELPEWVRAAEVEQGLYLPNLQTWALGGPPDSFDHQVPPLQGDAALADALRTAKEVLADQLVCFGLAESFEESLDMLRWTFGLPGGLVGGRERLNTRPEHQSPSLDRATRDLLAQQNAADVELYRFASELYAQRARQLTRYLIGEDAAVRSGSPPLGDGITLTPGLGLRGRGLHAIEERDDQRWCWTGNGPRTSIVVRADLREVRQIEIEIGARAAALPEAWKQLTVRFDGEVVTDLARHDDGLIAVGRVRTSARDDAAEHLIELEGPLQPPTESDGRSLGIALAYVELRRPTGRTAEPSGRGTPPQRQPKRQPAPEPGLRRWIRRGRRVARRGASLAARTLGLRDQQQGVRSGAGSPSPSGATPAPDGRATSTVAEVAEVGAARTAGPPAAPGSDLEVTALAEQLREVRGELQAVWELRDVLRRALDRIGNLEEELDALRSQEAADEDPGRAAAT